jgi:hypothetical protein
MDMLRGDQIDCLDGREHSRLELEIRRARDLRELLKLDAEVAAGKTGSALSSEAYSAACRFRNVL